VCCCTNAALNVRRAMHSLRNREPISQTHAHHKPVWGAWRGAWGGEMTMDVGTTSPSAALLRREPARPVSSTIPLDRYYSIADGVLNQARLPPPLPCFTHACSRPRVCGGARAPSGGFGRGWRGGVFDHAVCVWVRVRV